jgi:hypothetical protein
MNRVHSWIKMLSTWCVGVLCALAFGQAAAAVSGAIYTTISDGTTVNGNIYDSKTDVYLTGGPQNNNDPGLRPSGCSVQTTTCTNPDPYVIYYFQVTNPSGSVLLSTDDITCRQVLVQDGRIVGVPSTVPATCSTGLHAPGVADPSNGNTPVQLIPYNDTPNPGGEYKAWLTPVDQYGAACPTNSQQSFGFCGTSSKTDNFKIKIASIVACKFNDLDASGVQDPGEPFISGWPITATGVDAGGNTGQTVTVQTGPDGCVSFNVSGPFPATVTLTEGTLGSDWSQTAPVDGSFPRQGDMPAYTVTGGVVSTTDLQSGDTFDIDFGNHQCVVGVDQNCLPDTGGLTVTKTANPSGKFKWTLTKGVTAPTEQDISSTQASTTGATFNYTVNVTNDGGTGFMVTGIITLTNTSASDITATVTDAIGTLQCSITDSAAGVNEVVPANGSLGVPYTCQYPDGSVPSSGTNTATISNVSSGSTPDPATAPVVFSKDNITDSCVDVSDTIAGDLGTVCYGDSNPPPFTYSWTFKGDPPGTCTDHPNTATATANTTGATSSDNKSVKVCVGADLTVGKTASTSFTRTYNWTIVKKRKSASPVEGFGGTTTVNYEIDVAPDATTPFTDSGWTVTGTITVSNPNDWEPITVTSVTDALETTSNGTCKITSGTVGSIPVSGSAQFGYTCTYTAAPSPSSGTNTATANWSGGSTPHTTAQGTAPYAFGATPTTEVNKTVNITDTFNGDPTSVKSFGPVTYPNTGTFTYSRTVTIPANGCATYPNTGKIVETGQTSGASVEVCGPAATGALTMGFWQNKNGQGIISSSGPATGTCALTAWLRLYAPFQDLSATAPCGAVGSTNSSNVVGYVYNLIKGSGSTCGGATCNAMLKPQMLATALDVYFGGGPGGNPLNAPHPIGGVTIDLTKICPGTDAGSITGCENVSSAFGGAASLTVSQMLTYAASQSNVGGTTWYGNVKATQVLAKDAFDAVNNQRAFSP